MPPSRRSSSSSSSRSRSSSGSSRRSSSGRSYSSGPSRRSSSSSSYRRSSSSSSYGSHSYGGYSSGNSNAGGILEELWDVFEGGSDGDYGDSSDSYIYGYDDYSLKDALDDALDFVPKGIVGNSWQEREPVIGNRAGNKATGKSTKNAGGSDKVYYYCEFCETKLEEIWKEGYYPVCKNCGAQMTKKQQAQNGENGLLADADTGMDAEIPAGTFLGGLRNKLAVRVLFLFGCFLLIFLMVGMFGRNGRRQEVAKEDFYDISQETNLQIYGATIFLDETEDNKYRICESFDSYEKCIEWDYNIRAYYDAESDCYLWYNTDVSPNVWQYWYEDVAGDAYYGWMEHEDGIWYIEVSDTEWEEYTGDTKDLWSISE